MRFLFYSLFLQILSCSCCTLQIAKEGSSAATASTDDKRSSYLNSIEAMAVRNKYGSKYSQPVDDAENCADSDFMSTLSNSIEVGF